MGFREIGIATATVVAILFGMIISLLYLNQKEIYLGPQEFGIGIAAVATIFIALVGLLLYFNKREY